MTIPHAATIVVCIVILASAIILYYLSQPEKANVTGVGGKAIIALAMPWYEVRPTMEASITGLIVDVLESCAVLCVESVFVESFQWR